MRSRVVLTALLFLAVSDPAVVEALAENVRRCESVRVLILSTHRVGRGEGWKGGHRYRRLGTGDWSSAAMKGWKSGLGNQNLKGIRGARTRL